MPDLTTIFGSEINVVAQPRQIQRSVNAFPGAHGITSMFMGSRGYPITVSGKLFATGNTYEDALSLLYVVIDDIETYLWDLPATYTFKSITYNDVIFERFELLRDGSGKAFHWTAAGECVVKFVAVLRSLV